MPKKNRTYIAKIYDALRAPTNILSPQLHIADILRQTMSISKVQENEGKEINNLLKKCVTPSDDTPDALKSLGKRCLNYNPISLITKVIRLMVASISRLLTSGCDLLLRLKNLDQLMRSGRSRKQGALANHKVAELLGGLSMITMIVVATTMPQILSLSILGMSAPAIIGAFAATALVLLATLKMSHWHNSDNPPTNKIMQFFYALWAVAIGSIRKIIELATLVIQLPLALVAEISDQIGHVLTKTCKRFPKVAIMVASALIFKAYMILTHAIFPVASMLPSTLSLPLLSGIVGGLIGGIAVATIGIMTYQQHAKKAQSKMHQSYKGEIKDTINPLFKSTLPPNAQYATGKAKQADHQQGPQLDN